jgi:hypothetical protein
MNEKQMTFAEIEPSFIGEGKDMDDCIVVANSGNELIRITPTGDVFAPTLEAASEAGRVFVDAIRNQLKIRPIQEEFNLNS